MDGITLTFHLAGINNQNFLMRDEETGTYWQQISGAAISGPLAGKRLTLVSSDELTFRMWRAEEPSGTVLDDVPAYTSEYATKDWDVRMKKAPTVITHAQPGVAARDLMLGIRAFGASRAFPFDSVLKEKLINDHVGAEPIVLVVGPDGESVRAFHALLAGTRQRLEFYRTYNDDKKAEFGESAVGALMIDDTNGSKWTFRGCAIDGPVAGACLTPVEAIKDYWFDWRQYNPQTTVYRHRPDNGAAGASNRQQ